MTSTFRDRGAGTVHAWRRFWFRPEPAYTLGLVRIAFGALVFLWALELGDSLYARFGVTGFYPNPPSDPFLWTVFKLFPSDSAVLVGWLALMASSIALIVGWHSKLASILVFVLVISFQRRDPFIFNAGDGLIRIEALLMALAPAGAALSMDQRRRTGSFWSAQTRNLWALRLMQVQVSIIYLSTVVSKLRGDTWQYGSAVAYTLRLDDMLVLPVPWFVSDTPVIANALTWGTLLVELAIGVLVWNRRWRARVLFAGVVLHLSIMLTVVVGFFSLAMFVLYLTFVPVERATSITEAVARRLAALADRFKHDAVASEVPDILEAPQPRSPRRHQRVPVRVATGAAPAPPRGAPEVPAPTDGVGGGTPRDDVPRHDVDERSGGRHARRPAPDPAALRH